MKHAFLIIAHDNYEQLNFLISLLDNQLNDIYIHIDKKSPPPPCFKVNKSKLFIIDAEESIDVRWGDVSQIQCEMLLYEKAFSSNSVYSYYHLLSGYCLPIKSMKYIHSFFDLNKGFNFIGFGQYQEERFLDRIEKRHYLTKMYRETCYFKRIFVKIIRVIIEMFVNAILISKRDKSLTYKKGANWCSLTEDFVEYLVANKSRILKHYNRSYCADEVYKQTLMWNSRFKNTIYDCSDEFNGCMRLIDWDRGRPYVWGNEIKDYSIIRNSKCLFARKFHIQKYPQMISFIKELVYNDIEV